jgi:hypothetical protein
MARQARVYAGQFLTDARVSAALPHAEAENTVRTFNTERNEVHQKQEFHYSTTRPASEKGNRHGTKRADPEDIPSMVNRLGRT